mmetsp:Transcript_34799/g.98658  ORF Transcript_34799/g.98658 Transcript_34799/m.98658 type:complete len:114 (-) Transcript_34799:316-657(-)
MMSLSRSSLPECQVAEIEALSHIFGEENVMATIHDACDSRQQIQRLPEVTVIAPFETAVAWDKNACTISYSLCRTQPGRKSLQHQSPLHQRRNPQLLLKGPQHVRPHCYASTT